MKSQKIKTIICMVLLAFAVFALQGSVFRLDNQAQQSVHGVINGIDKM